MRSVKNLEVMVPDTLLQLKHQEIKPLSTTLVVTQCIVIRQYGLQKSVLIKEDHPTLIVFEISRTRFIVDSFSAICLYLAEVWLCL